MSDDISKPQPRIVCAANWTDRGVLVLGIRHHDAFMRQQVRALGHGFSKEDLDYQGFVDQFGKFYSRAEAWKVAEAAGQIIRRVGGNERDGGTLFSENLY